jgi:UDP-galactopyranose mutase
MNYDYLIVGAGFFGSVLAERIANDLDSKVLVIDKRTHIGGNCYPEIELQTGIEIHKYGTHIFHTSSKKVWDYITKFTEFNSYHHQVLTTYKNKVYQMPINLETINSFYNLNMRPCEAKEFIENEISKEGIINPTNLEEKAISLIGRPLYEAFIKGYTIKQWDKDPKELPPDIITRLPVRYNYNEEYFVDARWQGIPLKGYTAVFESLLDSPNIDIKLNCDYFENKNSFDIREKLIYTGPIDQFYDYKFGKLGWRSISLKRKIVDVEDYQGTSVMNYADIETKFTRIHEPKHLHPERENTIHKSVIFFEASNSDEEIPFYPVGTKMDNELFNRYKDLSEKEDKIIIGGRLGDYSYYDMDKTILAALKCYEEKIANRNSF